ncbi:amidohydrolase [Nocardioides sp.]|uniref:amidohydrolase n=1 Tax=Nocardioides sp. TaxID=35761 RepID=UPI002722E918|nr:amidohydrolase family protein [Nocardioides sp.]MDO9455573.1 amidohydrolase family protein [Nocardioides sp.]
MGDLLLRETRIVPLSGDVAAAGRATPVDVLVSDGVVTAVGPALERPDGVEEVLAAGRWLAPGLWDQHVHLGQWTLSRQRVDTSAILSPEEARSLVARLVADDPGRPVIGFGHRPGVWTRDVTVAELDEVSGVTPVVLIAGDAHHAWLNSAALAALGLGARDEVVRENEWFAAYELLTRLTGEAADGPSAYRASLLDAAAQGVVGLVDFEFTGGADEWVARWHDGCDVLRVRMASYADRLESVIAAGLRTGAPLVAGDDRLTMGSLKIISDGSLNTRTAWCCEPYSDGGSGAANLAAHELSALLARAHMSGLHVATHAIGDAAVGAALDAYTATGAHGSVEHAQLVARDDVPRLAALGLRASVQPAHLLDDRDLTELIWPGRGDRSFAFRWMLEAGARLVLGSDAPVSPLDPWLAMAAAVHRGRDDDDRDAWHPEHALTPQEALAASTDEQPTVAVGSRGDLVLLDHDPLAPAGSAREAAAALRRTAVALTVVGGRVAHRSAQL